MHHVTDKELGHWRYVHSAISDLRYGSQLSSAIHYYNLGVVQWIRPLLLKLQSYETQQRVKITNVASASSIDKDSGVCFFFFLLVFVISAFQVGYWLNWFNAELSPKTHWRGPRSQKVEGKRETM